MPNIYSLDDCIYLHIFSMKWNMAAAFKPLFDNECGVRNPLIELSQVYTHVTEVF